MLWLGFTVALVAVVSIGLGYYVMRQRKKKMQLQQALAEGRVTLKEADEAATDEDSPDKASHEQQD